MRPLQILLLSTKVGVYHDGSITSTRIIPCHGLATSYEILAFAKCQPRIEENFISIERESRKRKGRKKREERDGEMWIEADGWMGVSLVAVVVFFGVFFRYLAKGNKKLLLLPPPSGGYVSMGGTGHLSCLAS